MKSLIVKPVLFVVLFVFNCLGCVTVGSNDFKCHSEVNASKWVQDSVDVPRGTESPNEVHLTLQSFQLQHSITGHWPEFHSKIQKYTGEPGSEVQLFVAAYTYTNENDYARINAVFANPFSIDLAKVKSAKHNWLSPSFNLDTLPKDCAGGYWLGYRGDINTTLLKNMDEPRGKIYGPRDFLAHSACHQNAGHFWPITLDISEGRFLYLKIMVMEETGSSTVRKLDKKLDDQSAGELALEIIKRGSETDWVGIAKEVGGALVKKATKQYLDNTPLLDVEYQFVTEKGTQMGEQLTLPLDHKRLWTADPRPDPWPGTSLHLVLGASVDKLPLPPKKKDERLELKDQTFLDRVLLKLFKHCS